jgi:hypothetical protein
MTHRVIAILAAILAAILLLSSGCGSSSQGGKGGVNQSPDAENRSWFPPAAPLFNPALAMQHIRQLSEEIGPRPTGSEAERRADGYIRDAFSSMGYEDVVAQAYAANPGRTSYNVYVEDPGSRPEWVVVVGAHYDTAEGTGSPGADDNASGVAVMLELARLFHDSDNVPTLVFAAFASEESQEYYDEDMTYSGSQYLAERMREMSGKVVGMVNLDMVGVGDTPIVFATLEAPATLSDSFISFAERRNLDVGFVQDPGYWSDNESFEALGISSFTLEWLEDPNYHTPQDAFDGIRLEAIAQSGRLAAAFLKGLDANLCKRLQLAAD